MADELTDAVSPVSLVIPCRPEYAGLCRLVAGAVGMRDGLDDEAVADIKVMVTEACNCFLALTADGTSGQIGCSIRMDFDSRPGAFVITVIYPGRRDLISWLEGRDLTDGAGLGLTILKALADEVVEVDTAEGTALRLTKLLPA
jgi:anti-sigma regulatory factor (Ser/Thr protein kinase)